MGADNRLGRRQPHVEEDENFLRRFVIPEKDREALNLFRDLRDDLIERIFHASNSASARRRFTNHEIDEREPCK